jgi:type IV secretion system protein VirD4
MDDILRIQAFDNTASGKEIKMLQQLLLQITREHIKHLDDEGSSCHLKQTSDMSNHEHPIHIKGGHGTESVRAIDPANLQAQLRELFKVDANPASFLKMIMLTLGILLTPITLVGMVIGYKRGYMRFIYPFNENPRFTELPLIVKISIAAGILVAWLCAAVALWLILTITDSDFLTSEGMLIYMAVNMPISLSVFFLFRRWYVGMQHLLIHDNEDGSATLATFEDLREYYYRPGLWVGGGLTLDSGHILTVAGTGAGKSVNLFVNAILDQAYQYNGSFYVNDIKGELAAICAGPLKRMGKRVITINPWQLLPDNLPESECYNPLQLLSDSMSIDLVDDIALLAELLIPMKQDDKNAFFTNSARAMISGFLLYIVCSKDYPNPTLTDLWKMVRLTGDDFDNLLADMNGIRHPLYAETIKQAAQEIVKQLGSPETFSSIVSNVLDATSFMKSPALQKTLVNGFNPYDLTADQDTVVFFILPVDKLSSQSTLLRLVTVSMLRACVRKPTGKRVTFLLDETASMGYLSEVPTALAAYRGFGISMHLVFQDHLQIQAVYGNIWESLIANCKVRQYFGITDNTTLDYISTAMGKTTNIKYQRDWFGNITDIETKQRDLMTPDEVKTACKNSMLIFTGSNPVAKFAKSPYYLNPSLKKDGVNLYDKNPYYNGDQ